MNLKIVSDFFPVNQLIEKFWPEHELSTTHQLQMLKIAMFCFKVFLTNAELKLFAF